MAELEFLGRLSDVNGKVTAEDGAISDKDIIAFYPPVGGG